MHHVHARNTRNDINREIDFLTPKYIRNLHAPLTLSYPFTQYRSTKSEKMYPSMLSRGPDVEIEPYYCLPVGTVVHPGNGGMVPWSQPTSPTPPTRGFGGLLSPTHAGNSAGSRLTYPKKNDDGKRW